MHKRGFSFMEILIALLLISSISLALLKQQWQINRVRMQVQRQNLRWLQESNQREQGMSLLECLLGLGLALLLITLVMQQYLQIKQQSYLAVQAMTQSSRLQMVVDLLRRRGHQAGFTPCLPIAHLASFDHQTRKPLQTVEINQQPFSKLTFYRMSDNFVPVLPLPGKDTFTLLGKWRPRPQHALIVADCQHAEVLNAYQINAHEIRFSQATRFAYHVPVYLGEWLTESFWVSTNKRGQPALFYMQHQHAEELLSEVHGMQGDLASHKQHRVLRIIMDLEATKPLSLVIRMYHL